MSELTRIQNWNNIAGKENKLNIENVKLYVSLIEEELNEVKEALEKEDHQNLLEEFADVIYVATGGIHCMGENTEGILSRINDRNFDKFIPMSYLTTEKGEFNQLKLTDEISKTADHYGLKPEEIIVEKRGDYIIFMNSKGKIIKPERYRKMYK